tara:strand:- start:254 stop:571 length:318 start_codon:yes stop_codon:yes gene_type:complete
MKNHNHSPSVNVEQLQGKNTKELLKTTQLKTIFNYLQNEKATASMISEATGISQKNICRYKADLQLNGKLWELERKNCKLTGHKAYYLTTNPEFATIINQLNLFD